MSGDGVTSDLHALVQRMDEALHYYEMHFPPNTQTYVGDMSSAEFDAGVRRLIDFVIEFLAVAPDDDAVPYGGVPLSEYVEARRDELEAEERYQRAAREHGWPEGPT